MVQMASMCEVQNVATVVGDILSQVWVHYYRLLSILIPHQTIDRIAVVHVWESDPRKLVRGHLFYYKVWDMHESKIKFVLT